MAHATLGEPAASDTGHAGAAPSQAQQDLQQVKQMAGTAVNTLSNMATKFMSDLQADLRRF